MTAIGIGPGDDVWVSINPDRPGTLILIPRELVADVFRKGWIAAS